MCKQISARREGCRQTSRGSTLGVQSSRRFINSPGQDISARIIDRSRVFQDIMRAITARCVHLWHVANPEEEARRRGVVVRWQH